MLELRQIAMIVSDLEKTVERLTTELGIEVSINDDRVSEFGLRNAVLAVGETYIEVLTFLDPVSTGARYLNKYGDGGYMVIFQVDDHAPYRQRLSELGVRIEFESTYDDLNTMHLHPHDVGGTLLSLDESPAGSWTPGGPDRLSHGRSDVSKMILAAEVQSPDPDRRVERWAAILGRPVGPDRTIAVDNGGSVRFVPAPEGEPERFVGVDILAADRSRAGSIVDISGIRYRFV